MTRIRVDLLYIVLRDLYQQKRRKIRYFKIVKFYHHRFCLRWGAKRDFCYGYKGIESTKAVRGFSYESLHFYPYPLVAVVNYDIILFLCVQLFRRSKNYSELAIVQISTKARASTYVASFSECNKLYSCLKTILRSTHSR